MQPKTEELMASSPDRFSEFQGAVYRVTESISRSGMLCRTSRQLAELTLLDVRFQLPKIHDFASTSVWVECTGVVVHCEQTTEESGEMPFEVAIFFQSISEKNKVLLEDFLASRYNRNSDT